MKVIAKQSSMKIIKEAFSFRAAGLLLASLALLTVPMAAQQEVSPEHFEAKQGPAKDHKPAPAHKPTNKSGQRAGRQNSVKTKATSKPQVSAPVKTGLVASLR